MTMPNSRLSRGLSMINIGETLEVTSGTISSQASLCLVVLLELTCPGSTGDALIALIQFRTLSENAQSHIKASRYDAAIETLNQAVFALIGEDVSNLIPLSSKHGGGMQSSFYQNLSPERLVLMMRCCAHYTECYFKKNDYVSVRIRSMWLQLRYAKPRTQALDWATEMHAISRNISFTQPAPMFGMWSSA